VKLPALPGILVGSDEIEMGTNAAGMESRQTGKRDERALIGQVLSGDCNAFHELIRPYERHVYGLAYSVLRNAADAEEAAQEAMFKAYRNLGQLQDRNLFKSWLMRIALNEAQMKRRKDRQQLYESLDEDGEDDSGYSFPKSHADWRELPSEALEKEEMREAVRRAVANLPEHYRVVFVLADAEQMRYEEIAATLSITVASVKTRLHRARLKLQESLQPAFVPRFRDHLAGLKGLNPWSRARK